MARKDLRMIAVLVLMLMILAMLRAPARGEEATTTMYVTGVKSWLNGREKPDLQSEVDARFPLGTDVTVYEIAGQWAKVAGGESGYVWCSMEYLTSDSPNDVVQKKPAYTVESNGRVNVRDTPDINGNHVRWLKDGDTVQVQSWFDGWAYIGDGYVLGKWLNGEPEEVK